MNNANSKNTTPTGTGPLPLPTASGIGQFAFRDGVWYLTPALKTAPKAGG